MNYNGKVPTLEQLTFCENIAPRIARSVEDFLTDGRPHPFLRGIASGGLIVDVPEYSDDSVQGLRITEATGISDSFMSEKYPLIGFPEEVSRNGGLWSIMSETQKISRDRTSSKAIEDRWIDHELGMTFWDGERWLTAMHDNPGAPSDEIAWEDQWTVTEGLTYIQAEAIKSAAQQTKDIFDIASLFGNDSYFFDHVVNNIETDERTKRLLRLSSITIHNIHMFPDLFPEDARKNWMNYYGPAYQQLGQFQSSVHKLIDGRSFELDSGGIMMASCLRGPLPSTAEMLEKGENIPVNFIHPPVPKNFLV